MLGVKTQDKDLVIANLEIGGEVRVTTANADTDTQCGAIVLQTGENPEHSGAELYLQGAPNSSDPNGGAKAHLMAGDGEAGIQGSQGRLFIPYHQNQDVLLDSQQGVLITVGENDHSLRFNQQGVLEIDGQGGIEGQVLLSSGPNAPPQWKNVSVLVDAAPRRQIVSSTPIQLVYNLDINVRPFDTETNKVYTQVFHQGILKIEGVDYTVTGSRQITLAAPLNSDQPLVVLSF